MTATNSTTATAHPSCQHEVGVSRHANAIMIASTSQAIGSNGRLNATQNPIVAQKTGRTKSSSVVVIERKIPGGEGWSVASLIEMRAMEPLDCRWITAEMISPGRWSRSSSCMSTTPRTRRPLSSSTWSPGLAPESLPSGSKPEMARMRSPKLNGIRARSVPCARRSHNEIAPPVRCTAVITARTPKTAYWRR